MGTLCMRVVYQYVCSLELNLQPLLLQCSTNSNYLHILLPFYLGIGLNTWNKYEEKYELWRFKDLSEKNIKQIVL